MTALLLALAVAALGVAIAPSLAPRPRSPIGETVPPAWRPPPRTVVVADPTTGDV
jgi:DNA-binding transcriptional LysR family regulator